MPIEHDAGGTMITGNAINRMTVMYIVQGIEMHLNFGMRLTRMATPAFLRQSATNFTGTQYPRSRQGLEQALTDCRALLAQADADAIVPVPTHTD